MARLPRMVVKLIDYRITYTPVPRAASTRIKLALVRSMRDLPQKVAQDISRDASNVHRLYQAKRFRADQLPSQPGWFNFTVVRDPVARLLSVYDGPLLETELAKSTLRRRGWAPLPSRPDPDYFFENLARYRDASRLLRAETTPQAFFTGYDLSRFDQVYRAESLDDLSRDLSVKTAQIIRFPVSEAAQDRLKLHQLGPRAQSAVLAEVAPDMALYDQVIARRVA